MSITPINTLPVQQFIQTVKTADSSRQQEVRLDIATAKNLAFTLGIVMARLQGDLEKLVAESKSSEDDGTIVVNMDAGSGW